MNPTRRFVTAAAFVLAMPATAVSDAGETARVWVYLRDRGPERTSGVVALEEAAVSARSIDRRVRRSRGPVFDAHDLPVHDAYVDAIAATGASVRHASRYLNAVSATASPAQVDAIRRLDFVSRVAPVARYRRAPLPARAVGRAQAGDALRAPVSADDYGSSRRQLEQIGVIPLHDEGYHGEDILIAVLDAGFKRTHEALDHVDVVAEWDFIFGDSVTSDEPQDSLTFFPQHRHGTWVLSTLAGYAPGNLVGPAWAASVVLAKTEREFEEVIGEEDDFVRALEWADSIGVDIVTASIGYFDWYGYPDMDGNTAVTTVGCDIAASKGITVVTSAGNQGSGGLGWPGIFAPADGDSVIAVGAVDSLGVVARFSSRGPTYDGRIKPDLMAMGEDVFMASAFDSLRYVRNDGTSFSAPLVAGACALLLQMHPEWGPAEVLAALRSEASNAATPDNTYGWGIINAYQSAITGATGVITGVSLSLAQVPGGVSVTVHYGASGGLTVDVVRRKRTDSGAWGDSETIATGINLAAGESRDILDGMVEPGVYEYRATLTGDPSQVSEWRRITIPFALTLRQSAPNPFDTAVSGVATIRFTVGGPPAEAAGSTQPFERAELSIYDVRGARIRTLFSLLLGPGDYQTSWTGRNESGEMVASGVYFYRLSVGPRSLTRKMVLVGP